MRQHLPDILAVIGAALMAFGAWLAYPPSGYVLAGVLCIVAGSRMVIR